LVGPPQTGQRSLAPAAEPQDHGPEQRHRLDLPATPHQAAELRQEVQLPRRDQAGQLPADSDRLSSGHGVSSFSESLDNPMRTEDVAPFLPPYFLNQINSLNRTPMQRSSRSADFAPSIGSRSYRPPCRNSASRVCSNSSSRLRRIRRT